MRTSFITSIAIVVILATPATAATETPVRVTGRIDELDPVSAGGFLAWSQSTARDGDLFRVFAQSGGGSPFQVTKGPGGGAAGGMDGSRLSFHETNRRERSDIRLVDLATRARLPVPRGLNTGQNEVDPSISGDWMLFAREKPGRRYSKRLLLFNLSTGETRELDVIRGRKQFLIPGQVNGVYAVWHRCGAHGPCDVLRYEITTGAVISAPNPGGELQYTPGVGADGTMYYFRSGFGCGSDPEMLRYVSGGTPEVLVDFGPGTDGSDAFVLTEAGSTRVLYSRFQCGNQRSPSDIFQLINP